MSCLIGITCGWNEETSKHLLHDHYIQSIQATGGIPVLIPSVEPALAEEIYNRVDGLVFSGGDDLDPYLYGEEPLKELREITPRRDSFELELAGIAFRGSKPVLGICRGIQTLNIAAGGTLYQDICEFTGQQHWQEAPRWYPTHQVDIDKDSRLYSIIKKDSIRVNSYHHQGIKQVGRGLSVVGRSKDGMVEAIETTEDSKFIIGVQWHPESSWDKDELSLRLFSGLVEEARIKSNT